MLSSIFVHLGLGNLVFFGFVLSDESDGCEEELLLKEIVVEVHWSSLSSSSSSTVKLPFLSQELEEERRCGVGFWGIWVLGFGVGSYTSESFGLPQPQPAILDMSRVLISLCFLLEDIGGREGGRYRESSFTIAF